VERKNTLQTAARRSVILLLCAVLCFCPSVCASVLLFLSYSSVLSVLSVILCFCYIVLLSFSSVCPPLVRVEGLTLCPYSTAVPASVSSLEKTRPPLSRLGPLSDQSGSERSRVSHSATLSTLETAQHIFRILVTINPQFSQRTTNT
jgi:hypothetical protein